MNDYEIESTGVQINHEVGKTLVPIDGSPESDEALKFALETFPETEITALHVFRLPEGYWAAFVKSEEQFPQYKSLVSDAEDLLKVARQKASERGIEIDTMATSGKPAQTIVEQAVNGGFDQIVIGSHGRRGLARLVYGSVSESVVRRSPTSVIIVRHAGDTRDSETPPAITTSNRPERVQCP
ncbi:universal stress protein [Natronococcus wangiae]|uniref:universal stress protein n=1 Tax=Natronococcus wangiae TaxID=3068275 RepID=UPI00273D1A9F|nr:universal stress protein [Natronococcus sp. AD5]